MGGPGEQEGRPGEIRQDGREDIARLYWDLHTGREPAEHLISA